jgi:hypothetical protein
MNVCGCVCEKGQLELTYLQRLLDLFLRTGTEGLCWTSLMMLKIVMPANRRRIVGCVLELQGSEFLAEAQISWLALATFRFPRPQLENSGRRSRHSPAVALQVPLVAK